MGVRPVLTFPDERLYHASKPVRHFDLRLKSLIDDLTATLYAGPGVGLAAVQIGVLEQVSVIDIGRRQKKRKPSALHNGYFVLINPVLVTAGGEQIPREGCLSVPDLLANVRRHKETLVRTRTLEGGERLIKSVDFEALAVQHEMDHLEGKLFLDRVANVKTDIFRRQAY